MGVPKVAEPYFVKVNMANGAEAWLNLGNVTFIYQQAGAQTTVRFSGSTDNQITLKQSIKDIGELLPPVR
jgi:hypothetical protein